jgi:acyl carrier protein
MSVLENEIKQLIVSALALDDIDPGKIDVNAPLFGDGLGLDSIDALELSVVLARTYGVTIQAEDEKNRAVFASVKSLAEFVSSSRTK